MKKTIILAALLVVLAGGSAWGQLAVGGTGAVFANLEDSPEDVVAMFENGEGIFYGPFVEIGLGKLAIGAALNFSIYEDYSLGSPVEYIDYDVNAYLQGHMFKYKSFLDPFVEAGLGMAAFDYLNEEEDPDSDNPLLATAYFQVGGGLGINLGSLGAFVKVLYMIPGDPIFTKEGYSLEEYPLKPLKVFAGVKLIF